MTNTLTQEQPARPFTPSEKSAPKPLIHRAINHRVEALLTERRPKFFAQWLAEMERDAKGPGQNPKWGVVLLYVAAALPLATRGGFDWTALTPKQEQRLERNLRLLVTLAYRGCKNRGEF